MKLLLHTALLATVAIAAPVAQSKSDFDVIGGRGAYNEWDGSAKNLDTNEGRGGYNEWDGSSKRAEINDGRGGYNEWDGSSKDANTNDGRGGYNEWDGSAKDANTNDGRGGYNEWDGASKRSLYADFGRRWHHGRDSQRGSCDLRNAVMPAGECKHPQPHSFPRSAH